MNNLENILIALTEQVQAAEDAAFDVYETRSLENAFGSRLDEIGDLVGEPRGGLADAPYKVRLSARIAANKSRGVREDMITVARLVAGATEPIKFTKSSSTGAWDYGATSFQSLTGDGGFEFKAVTNTTRAVIGFTEAGPYTQAPGLRYNLIKWGWDLNLGYCSIAESGLGTSILVGTYVDGDKFRIDRVGTSIYYKRNDVIVYVSPLPANLPLKIDSALFSSTASFTSILMNDAFADVPLSFDNAQMLRKGLATNASDTWAYASTPLVGDGWLEFQAPTSAAQDRTVGLSTLKNNVSGFADITFSVNFPLAGNAQVMLLGAVQTSFVYATGDIIRVTRTGSTITIVKNGSLVYTFGSFSSAPLYPHIVIFASSQAITGIRLASSANVQVPIKWRDNVNNAPETMITIVGDGGPAVRFEFQSTGIATLVVKVRGSEMSDALATVLLEFLMDARRAGIRIIVESSPQPEDVTFSFAMASFLNGAHAIGSTTLDTVGDGDVMCFPETGYLNIEPGTGNSEVVAYRRKTASVLFELVNGPTTILHADRSYFYLSDSAGREIILGLGYGDTGFSGTVGGKFASVRASS